jgi:predicted alpha/beta hydrolase
MTSTPAEPKQLEPFTLHAADGYTLSALLVHPPSGVTPRGTLNLHPGTGYRKEFYLKLAQYLAEQGYVVLLFDYRGMAGSAPASLRGFGARMQDWGRLDMTAALDYIHQQFPHLPHYVLGHSMGGQLLGLMPNHQLIRAAITYGTSTGYFLHQAPALAAFCTFLWYVWVPANNHLRGYSSMRALGYPMDLPRNVAAEWADWCKDVRYLYRRLDTHIAPHHYHELQLPVLALRAADDPIATTRNAENFFRPWQGAAVEHRVLKPQDLGLKRIGHDGIFRASFQASVWPQLAQWLHGQAS